MPCATPAEACQDQSSLVAYFLRAHYAVGRLTNPCGRLWTLEDAQRAYAYENDFCATCIVWGTLPICKETGETYPGACVRAYMYVLLDGEGMDQTTKAKQSTHSHAP